MPISDRGSHGTHEQEGVVEGPVVFEARLIQLVVRLNRKLGCIFHHFLQNCKKFVLWSMSLATWPADIVLRKSKVSQVAGDYANVN